MRSIDEVPPEPVAGIVILRLQVTREAKAVHDAAALGEMPCTTTTSGPSTDSASLVIPLWEHIAKQAALLAEHKKALACERMCSDATR